MDDRSTAERTRDALNAWLGPSRTDPLFTTRSGVVLGLLGVPSIGIGLMANGYILWGWAITCVGIFLTVVAAIRDRRNAVPGEIYFIAVLLIIEIVVPFYLFDQHSKAADPKFSLAETRTFLEQFPAVSVVEVDH